MLAIGTRIQFLRQITEPADGDHPTFLLAEKDQQGTITGHREGEYKYEVKTYATFLANEEDFKVVS